jgi:hypothetical protein
MQPIPFIFLNRSRYASAYIIHQRLERYNQSHLMINMKTRLLDRCRLYIGAGSPLSLEFPLCKSLYRTSDFDCLCQNYLWNKVLRYTGWPSRIHGTILLSVLKSRQDSKWHLKSRGHTPGTQAKQWLNMFLWCQVFPWKLAPKRKHSVLSTRLFSYFNLSNYFLSIHHDIKLFA